MNNKTEKIGGSNDTVRLSNECTTVQDLILKEIELGEVSQDVVDAVKTLGVYPKQLNNVEADIFRAQLYEVSNLLENGFDVELFGINVKQDLLESISADVSSSFYIESVVKNILTVMDSKLESKMKFLRFQHLPQFADIKETIEVGKGGLETLKAKAEEIYPNIFKEDQAAA